MTNHRRPGFWDAFMSGSATPVSLMREWAGKHAHRYGFTTPRITEKSRFGKDITVYHTEPQSEAYRHALVTGSYVIDRNFISPPNVGVSLGELNEGRGDNTVGKRLADYHNNNMGFGLAAHYMLNNPSPNTKQYADMLARFIKKDATQPLGQSILIYHPDEDPRTSGPNSKSLYDVGSLPNDKYSAAALLGMIPTDVREAYPEFFGNRKPGKEVKLGGAEGYRVRFNAFGAPVYQGENDGSSPYGNGRNPRTGFEIHKSRVDAAFGEQSPLHERYLPRYQVK